VPEPTITAPPLTPRRRSEVRRAREHERKPPSLNWVVWLLVAAVVVGIAIVVVAATGMRPGYDAYGWLVWGRQVLLHWDLNTDGAPSWKPLPFVFTLPYALFGSAQVWLWMVTSVAGALAGAVFAARIAFRLTGPSPGRTYAPYVAAAVAGLGVLGLDGYSHLVLIASSDPLIVTLCLAAIDAHLSGRPRLAFAMLVLASLGRPEAWPFAGLYALWSWRAVPSMRILAVVGILLIPAFWFIIPALTSKSWFTSGDLALSSVNPENVIHGSKILGVTNRFFDLTPLSFQVAALMGLVIAVLRRDKTVLILAGAVCLWLVVEIAMALHGWSGAERYVAEPAALMVLIAAYAVGQALAFVPRGSTALRWVSAGAAVLLVIALGVSTLSTARERVRIGRSDVTEARFAGTQIKRLQSVVKRDGGASRIKACGQPVSLVGLQSKIAWATSLNVGNVGYRPGHEIDSGQPIVFFKPHGDGWEVQPIHIKAADVASCKSLKIDSAF
jgi:hypothetical protein